MSDPNELKPDEVRHHGKPRMYHRGCGWWCEGNGVQIFASTRESAYEAWRFVVDGGYTSVYGREHGMHHGGRR